MEKNRANRTVRGEQAMTEHSYRLRFSQDGRGTDKELEFYAYDAARAIPLVEREAPGSPAELWCDDRLVCQIKRNPAGAWEILPVPKPSR